MSSEIPGGQDRGTAGAIHHRPSVRLSEHVQAVSYIGHPKPIQPLGRIRELISAEINGELRDPGTKNLPLWNAA